jgi:hypothetical protein
VIVREIGRPNWWDGGVGESALDHPFPKINKLQRHGDEKK